MRQDKDTKTLPDGSVFITHSACYFGDYVGSGTWGKANIRDLRSLAGDKWEEVDEQDWDHGAYNWEGDSLVEIDPDTNLVITTSSYNYHCGWVREAWDEGRKAIEGLEHYPVIDEGTLCEVEHEDEQEAWASYIKRALLRTGNEEDADLADDLPDDVLYEAFREAMETCNSYPEHETEGVYIDIDAITEEFWEEVIPHITRWMRLRYRIYWGAMSLKWKGQRWCRYKLPLILRGEL